MSAISTFRQKLASGQTCLGPAISFTDPLVTAALADTVDYFWIDTEHAMMSFEALQGHFLAAHGKGKPALVRVPVGEVGFIKPVLDAGADGIVVPQIVSAEEARRVVDICRYPPMGHRGFGPRVSNNFGREASTDYVNRMNEGPDSVFVSVQIETREAVAAADEIVSIPGLDSVVFGPWDLSAAFGMLGQIAHPTVTGAMEGVIAKARAAGKFVGCGGGSDPTYITGMIRRGVQWFQFGGDYGYLIYGANQLYEATRAMAAGTAVAPVAGNKEYA